MALQGSGADVLLTAAIPKFAAQAIRKVYDIGWKPTHFLTNVSISVGAVMKPAGPEKGVGIISGGVRSKIRPIRSGRTRRNSRNGWRG